MEATEEEINKWLSVYAPEKLGVSYPPKEEILKMLQDESQREEALEMLWRVWCFRKHLYDYESGRIPEREETTVSDCLRVEEHENDLGINLTQNTQNILSKRSNR